MATHSSVLAWRIPGTEEPGGWPSMGSHRVGHDWSDLAAAAAADHRLNSCGTWAWLLRSVWDLSKSGIKTKSPALAGGFLTTEPPGKPEDRVLTEVSSQNEVFRVGPNAIWVWCPHKKRRLGHRHTWREDRVRTQGDCHAQAKQRRLWRNHAANPVISDLCPAEQWENKCPLFKPPSLWYFVMAALAN